MTRHLHARLFAAGCLIGSLALSCASDDKTREEVGTASAVDGGSAAPPPTSSDSASDAGRTTPANVNTRDAATRTDAGGNSRRRPVQECPPSLIGGVVPENGSACVTGRGACTFGTLTCDCPGDTLKWVCWQSSQCPGEAPAEGAACPLVDMECEYLIGDRGDDLECQCTATGWDCGRQVCPAAEPTAGAACQGGDGVCTFGGRVCDCRSRAWVCWNASDCPTTTPALGSACPVERMQCMLPGDDECECTDEGWECESQEEEDEDDEEQRRDAGARDASVASDSGATVASDAAVSSDAAAP